MARLLNPRRARDGAPAGPRRSVLKLETKIAELRQRVDRLNTRPAPVNVREQFLEEMQEALEELETALYTIHERNRETDAAHEHVRVERAKYRDLFDSAPDGYLVTDPGGLIKEANRAAAELLGVAAEFLVGKPVVLFLPKGEIRTVFHRGKSNGHKPSARPETFEVGLVPRARASFPAAISVARTSGEDPAGDRLLWLIRDVSNQREAERLKRENAEQLRRLSRRLLRVQEDERRMLARDLHDEIGQYLVGIKLNLAIAARDEGNASQGAVQDAMALVDEVVARTRRVAFNLRPPTLDLGLGPALRSLSQQHAEQTRLAVIIDDAGVDGHIAPDLTTTVYRIAQEALTNVLRHAGVDKATIRLRCGEGWLRIEVEDGGLGFDPDEAMRAGAGNGLAGMHERVALVDGHLVVNSGPGQGTRIIARFPLGGSANHCGSGAGAAEGDLVRRRARSLLE